MELHSRRSSGDADDCRFRAALMNHSGLSTYHKYIRWSTEDQVSTGSAAYPTGATRRRRIMVLDALKEGAGQVGSTQWSIGTAMR